LACLRSECRLRPVLTGQQGHGQVSTFFMAKESHRRHKCHGRVTGMAAPLPCAPALQLHISPAAGPQHHLVICLSTEDFLKKMAFVESAQEESAVTIDLQWAAAIIFKYDKSTFFPSKASVLAML